MTQRIFDIENEEDMQDLWSILPDDVTKIKRLGNISMVEYGDDVEHTSLIKINWHDKTEITRPIQEATEEDIGKICYFWEGKDFNIGVLKGLGDDSSLDIYCMEDGKSGIWFTHCRRLTKQEIKELC